MSHTHHEQSVFKIFTAAQKYVRENVMGAHRLIMQTYFHDR